MRTVFDPTDPGSHAYGLLTSIVVPRPIAWISTLDADGVGNLAPHSFFTVVSAHPAMVSFTSVGRKDTVRNVVATGHFVVNLVTEDLAELANASSAPFAPEVDEAQTLMETMVSRGSDLGVRLEPSAVVPVPRVADSPASIECTLHSTLALGDAHLVVGEVRAITVDDATLVDGLPTIEALRPVSRLGRDEWGHSPEVFRLQRPRRP